MPELCCPAPQANRVGDHHLVGAGHERSREADGQPVTLHQIKDVDRGPAAAVGLHIDQVAAGTLRAEDLQPAVRVAVGARDKPHRQQLRTVDRGLKAPLDLRVWIKGDPVVALKAAFADPRLKGAHHLCVVRVPIIDLGAGAVVVPVAHQHHASPRALEQRDQIVDDDLVGLEVLHDPPAGAAGTPLDVAALGGEAAQRVIVDVAMPWADRDDPPHERLSKGITHGVVVTQSAALWAWACST